VRFGLLRIDFTTAFFAIADMLASETHRQHSR
jgi:hypothetical protein